MNHNGSVQTLDAARKQLNHLHDTLGLSWREIAARREYSGIPHGTLCSIANGREPKDERHRRVLGLAPVAIEVPPCPDCGQLHEQKATCPSELQKQRSGPKRHRLHYECGRGDAGRERREAIAAEMEAMGCESFTQFVDWLRAEHSIRLGICPDCGNDSCMADGVTGLWCPACDASYLLDRKR